MTRFALFYHSVISDWNHGNAHFLRGLMRSLQKLGHQVTCYEPRNAWAVENLLRAAPDAIQQFEARFPDLRYERYDLRRDMEPWLRERLAGADVAIVHEWNEPWLVNLIARLCHKLGVRPVFHDTHYRVVLDEAYRTEAGLEQYETILAFSPSVAERFRDLGFDNVYVVHEAADTTVFFPRDLPKRDDVVFVGNYGDGDRNEELEQFVFKVRQRLPGLRYAVYGVRYPNAVLARFRNGLDVDYRGWAPNAAVPEIYSQARVVLHVPRRQYVQMLPGTPTIRVFEALASGACLVSLPWPDTDNLFTAGQDYAVASTPAEMHDLLAHLTRDDAARQRYGSQGRETILARHTCDHRAQQILEILQ